jgi:hypothetical protein
MCVMICHGTLLDQVNESEDRNPDHVDEVPVQGSKVNDERIIRSKTTTIIDR